ncbi:MAG: hypothetical protein AAF514_15925 [Verrucomicrobiota bacterium]
MKNEEIAGQEPAKSRVVSVEATVTQEFTDDLKKGSEITKIPPHLLAGVVLSEHLHPRILDQRAQRYRAKAAEITGETKVPFEMPLDVWEDLEEITAFTGLIPEQWVFSMIRKEAKRRRRESFRVIINGRLYDTKTAARIDEVTSGHQSQRPAQLWRETLYRTKSKVFFLHCQGEENAERHANDEAIQLMSEADVKVWLEYHNLTFSYEELFTVEEV